MLITARPDDEKTSVDVTVKLTKKQAAILAQYADVIGEKPGYVVGALVDKFLATDKDFLAERRTRTFIASTDAPARERKVG